MNKTIATSSQNPSYQTAKPRLLPNGWVEIDAVRWAGMLQTAAYFAKPKSGKGKK